MSEKPIAFLISADEKTINVAKTAAQSANMALLLSQSAERAVGQAKLANPDIVILDDSVQGADWFDVYRSLSEELSFTFIPVLVVLDADKAEDAVSRMETGLVDILVRPLTVPSLRSRLKAMQQVKEIHDQMDTERLELQKKLEEERKLREQLTSINEELKKLSTTDGLTGLANYRYMTNWLATEFEIAMRYKLPLSAVMIDIDNFKQLNDRHGHPFGDFVLKGVSAIILDKSRKADFAARYGGDEFMVVLPNTPGTPAANLAKRIHKAIEGHLFDDGQHNARVTASLGISTFPCDAVTSSQALIDLADRSLYAAKSRGRNRIVDWSEVDK